MKLMRKFFGGAYEAMGRPFHERNKPVSTQFQ